jgi:hypothetical protein
MNFISQTTYFFTYFGLDYSLNVFLGLSTASKTVFRETSSAGSTSLSENTTIRADPIVLNDTSHSTAHEAGKEAPLWADK